MAPLTSAAIGAELLTPRPMMVAAFPLPVSSAKPTRIFASSSFDPASAQATQSMMPCRAAKTAFSGKSSYLAVVMNFATLSVSPMLPPVR
jgi:hypothetical protein